MSALQKTTLELVTKAGQMALHIHSFYPGHKKVNYPSGLSEGGMLVIQHDELLIFLSKMAIIPPPKPPWPPAK